MPELRLHVPTYWGTARQNVPDQPDFAEPYVPVVVREAEGIRVVLGTHDYWDGKAPDVQIERCPHGWAMFLHPIGGCDPSGYVYFQDDGRSFVVPERASTLAMELTEWETAVAAVHTGESPEHHRRATARCELCERNLEPTGDELNGLCRECADLVSAYLDLKNLNKEKREAVVAFLKRGP